MRCFSQILFGFLCIISTAAVLSAADSERDQQFRNTIRPLLANFCFECHGDIEAEAGLNLEQAKTFDHVVQNYERWKKVAQKIEHRQMPPQEADQPSLAQHKILVAWLSDAVQNVTCVGEPDPGWVTIRRLNGLEYRNTIRDLVGVNYEPAADFPGDDVGYGFDNIGDVLSLPPILMEKYLDAAEEIADLAIDRNVGGRQVDIKLPGSALKATGGSSPRNVVNRVLTTTGEMWTDFNFSIAGEYTFTARAFADQAGDEVAKMELRIDGKTVKRFDVQNEIEKPGDFTVEKVKISAGKHKVALAFTNDYYDPRARDRNRRDRNLYVSYLHIAGPTDFDPLTLPKSHRDIFFVMPSNDLPPREAAEKILRRFASRAYRRPATASEVQRLTELAVLVGRREKSFTAGIHFAIQAVLASPHFLYKVESPPQTGQTKTISEFELATNLSYFLWNTMPDDELFSLARKGELRKGDNLSKQVARMLADPKSEAMIKSFSGQWLQLRSLADLSPDTVRFPTWSNKLAQDIGTETEMFFGSIVQENRPIVDLLNADYTFLNDRLARHYEISGVRGGAFRKVTLNDSVRGGILTHASILTVTSNPTRTSPVKRGKWVLENLLGEPPPPPAPDIMELEDQTELTGTLREKMEQHRADPGCASCHAQMDPIGFALQNFNAIGGWRERDGGAVINATGELPSGDKFTGPIELRKLLTTRLKEKFVRAFTEKLLIYSLGRGLTYYDQCAINEIVKASAKDDHRFASLITAIVHSTPFQKRRAKK